MTWRAAAAVAACAIATGAFAAEPAPNPAAPAIAAEKALWQARFHEAREAVASAKLRHDAALEAYQQMRHRRKDRGEEKQKILDELTASEDARDAAASALEELFDRARRAGVPPGWMRMKSGN